MRLWTTLISILVAACVLAAPPVLPAYTEDNLTGLFGSDKNVALVAPLLADKDFTVRERAVTDLGEMQNYKGLEFIRKAAKDDNPQVRSAAALAAMHFPVDMAGDIVVTCLQDKEPTVAMNALLAVRTMPLPAASPQVVALVSHEQSAVQATAVATLTALKLPLDAKTLAGLLDSPSPIVRLRALENMMLLDADKAPKDKLPALTGTGPAAVCCAALAALGKFGMAGDNQIVIIAVAGKNADPQIRLGAVLAIQHAGYANLIKPFIDDQSEMVRLAAIRAAGVLKAKDCAQVLMRRMLDAPMGELPGTESQLAARDSLIAIGTPEVAQLAADEFTRIAPQFQRLNDLSVAMAKANANPKAPTATAGKDDELNAATLQKLARDVRACCRILGGLKSKLVLDGPDGQIALLAKQPTDSAILPDLIWSLGEIGDAKALPTLEAYTDQCTVKAQEALAARLIMPPPHVPYSDEGTAQCLVALEKLKSPNLLAKARKLGLMKVQTQRLATPVMEAIKVYGHLYPSAKDHASMEADMIDIAGDSHYSRVARCDAMKLLGQWKAASAVRMLEDILNKERPNRTVMEVAAWSLYQIDGKERAVSNPVVVQGAWIVTEEK